MDDLNNALVCALPSLESDGDAHAKFNPTANNILTAFQGSLQMEDSKASIERSEGSAVSASASLLKVCLPCTAPLFSVFFTWGRTFSSQVKVLEERLKEESLRALKLKGMALQSVAPIDKMPASSIFDQAIKVRYAKCSSQWPA